MIEWAILSVTAQRNWNVNVIYSIQSIKSSSRWTVYGEDFLLSICTNDTKDIY